MTEENQFDWLRIKDLSGGLNVKDSSYAIRDNESQLCKNLIITSKGTLKLRRGYVASPAGAISGSQGIDNVFRFYGGGSTSYTVVSSVTTTSGVYTIQLEGTSGWSAVTGGTALAAFSQVRFCDFKENLFIYNGLQWQYTTDCATKADVGFYNSPGYIGADPGSGGVTAITPYLQAICDDRVFVVPNEGTYGRQRFFWSDYGGWISDPSAMRFQLANYIDMPLRSGDNVGITAMQNYGKTDDLVIFRQNDTWVLSGVGTSDYQLINISGSAGCVSPRGVCVTPEGDMIVVGNDNIFEFTNGTMRPIGDRVKNRFAGKSMVNAVCEYDAVSDCVIISYPDGCLVWNIAARDWDEKPVRAWTEFSYQPAAMARCWKAIDYNKFYLALTGSNKLYYLDGITDDGSAFTWEYQSKDFDFEAFEVTKQFRSAQTLQKTTTTTPMTLNLIVNGGDVIDSKVVTVENKGIVWGGFIWGLGVWGGNSKLIGKIRFDDGLVGNLFSVYLTATSLYDIEIYRVAIEYYVDETRRT
jgi:hypothetical protein